MTAEGGHAVRRCAWRRGAALAVVAFLFVGVLVAVPREAEAQSQVDYILIRDAPNDGGSVVGDRVYHTGQNDTYYAAGYNNTTGYVGDVDAQWISDDRDVIETSWNVANSTVVTAKEYGTTQVVAASYNPTVHGFTGNLTVISDIDYVILRNESGGNGTWFGDITLADDSYIYLYAAGYNSSRGYLRDVPVYWTSTNETICQTYHSGPQYRRAATQVTTNGRGNCVITGSYSPGVSNRTGSITVVSNVDYVIIRDAHDDGGLPVENQTYVLDTSDSFYAAGYNYTTGYVRDVIVMWDSSDDVVCPIVLNNSANTWLNFATSGTCHLTANYAWIAFDMTGTLTIIFDVDYVVIRDSADGGGQPVTVKSLLLGYDYYFYAAGYNRADGYRRDVVVTWGISNQSVCRPVLEYPGPAKYLSVEALFVGVCRVNVTFHSSVTNATGDLTVVFDIDYITIRDAPGGGGNVLGTATLYAFRDYSLYAAGYNNTLGFRRDVEATWNTSSPSICPSPYRYNNYATLRPRLPGVCRVSADVRGLVSNQTGDLRVFEEIDHVVITDTPGGSPITNSTYFTGMTAKYWADGYNFSTGLRGNVAVEWSSDNYSICMPYQSSSSSVDMIFFLNGSCTLHADYHGVHANDTGITVEWDIDYLIIMDAPRGTGSRVDNRTYLLHDRADFYAAGFNNSFGFRRDLVPDWNSTDTVVCGFSETWPTGYTTLYANGIGSCSLSADYQGVVSNSTGTITVYTDIDSVIIRDGPVGSGTWVGDRDYIITTEHNLYAAAYNATRGFLQDLDQVDAVWSVNSTRICRLSEQTNYSVIRAQGVGYCRVEVSFVNSMHNSTGSIRVISRPTVTVDDDGGRD